MNPDKQQDCVHVLSHNESEMVIQIFKYIKLTSNHYRGYLSTIISQLNTSLSCHCLIYDFYEELCDETGKDVLVLYLYLHYSLFGGYKISDEEVPQILAFYSKQSETIVSKLINKVDNLKEELYGLQLKN